MKDRKTRDFKENKIKNNEIREEICKLFSYYWFRMWNMETQNNKRERASKHDTEPFLMERAN